MEESLLKIYTDPKFPGGFSSVSKLYKEGKKIIPNLKLNDVKSFLRTQDSFTQYGNVRNKYMKRPVYVSGPGIYLSADLADFRNLSKHNKGVNYLLFIIDVFSRKLNVYPIKNKKTSTIAKKFEDFFKNDSRYTYRFLWTDEGNEFFGAPMKILTKKYNITQYHVFNRKFKAALVERAILTYKQKLYRLLHHHNTKNHVRFIKPLLEGYNKSNHNGLLNLSPNFVHIIADKKILMQLAKLIYKKKFLNYSPRYLYKKILTHPTTLSSKKILAVGTAVRLLTLESEKIFSKNFLPIFSVQIFEVDKIYPGPPLTYRIRDLTGEKIDGTIYPHELSPVIKPVFYTVERKIDTKFVNGKKFVLVKWLDYDNTFNQWIPESWLKDI